MIDRISGLSWKSALGRDSITNGDDPSELTIKASSAELGSRTIIGIRGAIEKDGAGYSNSVETMLKIWVALTFCFVMLIIQQNCFLLPLLPLPPKAVNIVKSFAGCSCGQEAELDLQKAPLGMETCPIVQMTGTKNSVICSDTVYT